MLKKIQSQNSSLVWDSFVLREKLSSYQESQFWRFQELLVEWNGYFNLTAITDPDAIVIDHFQDSLALRNCYDMSLLNGIADVGSGAGFPGIPLAIVQPHCLIVLIEVNGKKRRFLENLVLNLALKNVVISSLDWLTFIRKTDYPLNIFCARASLKPDILIQQFAHNSHYSDATIVYWASEQWSKKSNLEPYCIKEWYYNNGKKNRKLVFMQRFIGHK